MNTNRLFLPGIAASLLFWATASLPSCNRTWVSGTGDDADTTFGCPRVDPCATFKAALSVTSAGGEIDVLDSGDFGSVTIDKAVSIVAPGDVAGIQVVASGADGIVVNAGPSDAVFLRGLTIGGLSGATNGIKLSAGGALYVEHCTINGFAAGILVEPAGGSTRVFIDDTIVRNNGVGISFAPTGGGTVTASLDNVRTENNGAAGVESDAGAVASVRNSVSDRNGTGFFASASGGFTVINLESIIASGNGTGIDSGTADSTINMSNVTVIDNGTGLSPVSGGHIVSFGNNKITDNGTNGLPTKTVSQQ
jgi:hypothetical protein